MAETIGELLPLAVVVALSPPPIIAAVVILAGDRGRLNASALVASWALGLVAIGLIVLSVADFADASDAGEPATWVRLLKLVLGLLLVVLAMRAWRGRSRTSTGSRTPKWMGSLAGLTLVKAVGLGLALSAVNPKNIVLSVAAGAAIAETGLSAAEQAIAYTVFVAIATAGVGTPLVLAVLLGDRSRQPLDRLRGWMIANNAATMSVLLLVIGVTLIGNAIGGQ